MPAWACLKQTCFMRACAMLAAALVCATTAPVHAMDPVTAQAQAKAAVQNILNAPVKRKLGAAYDPNAAQQQSNNAYVSGLVGRPVTVQQLSATLLAGTAPIYTTLLGMGTWTNGVYRAGDTALILGQTPAAIATSGAGSDLTSPVPANLLPGVSAQLDQLGTARGSILYRSASGWTVIPPGATGYLLSSGGQNSDPVFVPPAASSGGTVTGVTGGTGLSGGTISQSGTLAVLYGTGAGTAAQGNDARIVGALQSANNLSDVASPSTARASIAAAASGANTDITSLSNISYVTGGYNIFTGLSTQIGGHVVGTADLTASTVLTAAQEDVCVNATAATTITLSGTNGLHQVVSDCKGTAASAPITVAAPSGMKLVTQTGLVQSITYTNNGQGAKYVCHSASNVCVVE